MKKIGIIHNKVINSDILSLENRINENLEVFSRLHDQAVNAHDSTQSRLDFGKMSYYWGVLNGLQLVLKLINQDSMQAMKPDF
jgi:hypothetical protein